QYLRARKLQKFASLLYVQRHKNAETDDPRGKNRPFAGLCAVFCPWSPTLTRNSKPICKNLPRTCTLTGNKMQNRHAHARSVASIPFFPARQSSTANKTAA